MEDSSSSGLTVLFLSSDTGGGHRASAESLAKQFQLLFPGSTCHIVDILTLDCVPPWNSSVDRYKHLSAHPNQWKTLYNMTNTKTVSMLADAHLKFMCEPAIRKRIKSYEPDIVISVHPLMTNVPAVSCAKISKETGKHLPIFTVVTDLGSGHSLWFASGVEKLFIASEQIRTLAKTQGKVPDEKLIKVGLPIRHEFALQADALGDRMSVKGELYQKTVRQSLGLNTEVKTVLVMGGGEGVGSLSYVVDALYLELTEKGIDSTILVVCGRNEKLKKDLEEKDWSAVLLEDIEEERSSLCWKYKEEGKRDSYCWHQSSGCVEGGVTMSLKKILSNSSLTNQNPIELASDFGNANGEAAFLATLEGASDRDYRNENARNIFDECDSSCSSSSKDGLGKVKVIGLGFITRMAEYMVAADVLVTKAGPGTIAEAASVGLPVMLTSFLPGQEEGNIDFVVEGKFGSFCSNYFMMADEISSWLRDRDKLRELSAAARRKGTPNAAADIVRIIGQLVRLKNLEITPTK